MDVSRRTFATAAALATCSPATQDCGIGPPIASWRLDMHRTSLTTVANCRISTHASTTACAHAPMTSEYCLCHAHTIDSQTEALRPPVPDCGTIYHLNCDGQTRHFQFSSRNWERICLCLVIVETAAHSDFHAFRALYNTLCTYVCMYTVCMVMSRASVWQRCTTKPRDEQHYIYMT